METGSHWNSVVRILGSVRRFNDIRTELPPKDLLVSCQTYLELSPGHGGGTAGGGGPVGTPSGGGGPLVPFGGLMIG